MMPPGELNAQVTWAVLWSDVVVKKIVLYDLRHHDRRGKAILRLITKNSSQSHPPCVQNMVYPPLCNMMVIEKNHAPLEILPPPLGRDMGLWKRDKRQFPPAAAAAPAPAPACTYAAYMLSSICRLRTLAQSSLSFLPPACSRPMPRSTHSLLAM